MAIFRPLHHSFRLADNSSVFRVENGIFSTNEDACSRF
jgi:hypothetical protein